MIQLSLMLATTDITFPISALVAGTVASLVSAWAGDHLARRFSEQTFRVFLSRFLIYMVLALLLRATFAA